MIRIARMLLVGTLLLFGSLHAADVSQIDLSYVDGATVARITVNGPVRYMHQTEIPKDGKPYRVIVDVLSAEHNLGAMEFLNLPACPVTGIRTSQYAVAPEKIVRVVFDMKGSPLYQIRSEENAVVVTFPDKDGQAFAAWTSGPSARKAASADQEKTVKQPDKTETVASQNAAIKKDRLASLDEPDASASPTPSIKPKADEANKAANPPDVAKVDKSDTVYHPELPSGQPRLIVPSDQPKPTPAAKTSSSSQKKAVVQKPAGDDQKGTVTTKSAELAKTPAKTVTTPSEKVSKPTPPTDKSQPKTVKATESGAKTSPSMADKADEVEETPEERSTSRFRRNPDKIKGTIVAEFPKRLVIKYKPQIGRDPFATLIVDDETHDGPIERQVPNVEGLRLVGIIVSRDKANRALLQDKQDYSYILKSGDKVRNGYVLRVDSDRVYFQIFEYGWSRTVALALDEY
jgi:hypothetical protein